MIPDLVLDHINKSQERFIKELYEFLRIPSISSSEHISDARRAAEWLLGYVKQLGFTGGSYETAQFPVVYAELCPYNDAPTLLAYGHYDVQPPGLHEEWKTLPFSPDVRDGAIYARGSADDKGQLFCTLAAIESILAVEGKLPLNVKLLYEGEEEIGSPGVKSFVSEHASMLKADAVLMTDAPKYTKDIPAIYYGLRGGVAFRVVATGPGLSVHSGMFGGAIANPVNALARILGNVKDDKGKIVIPGFYNHVRDIDEWERKEIAALPFDANAIKKYLGISEFASEEGYTPLESIMTRPTFDVNGMAGGSYNGEMQWSIPDSAGAYVCFLLVPDQEPDEITRLFEEYVRSMTPEGIKVSITKEVSFDPVLLPRNSEAIKVMEKAIEYVFGRRPVMIRSGGGIGVVVLLKQILGLENIVITGWNDPEDHEHGPDEHFSLENFRKGMITTTAFMYGLAEAGKPQVTVGIAKRH